ncbi:prosaposin-like [Eudromia elegans]
MESRRRGWVLVLALCWGAYQAAARPACDEREPALRPHKGVPCHLCQVAVSVLGKILQDNCTEDKLRAFLEKGCQRLPFQDWSTRCKTMVDTGILVLTQLGKQVLSDPKVVCGTIKLCGPRADGALAFEPASASSASPAGDFAWPAASVAARAEDESGQLCGACARLAAAVLDMGAADLGTHCESLGPLLAPACQRLAAAHGEAAVRLLRLVDARALCSLAGACPAPPPPLAEALLHVLGALPPHAEGSTPLCDVCQVTVRTAESLLESNVTEEQLVEGMEKVCDLLPHAVLAQCRDFVDSYGKAVLTMLLEATEPQAVCALLRCCPRAPAGTGDQAAALARLSAGALCLVCQSVVTYVDNELLRNETLAELGGALDKGCELLPPPLAGQCEALVAQYEPAALRLLVQVLDPAFVCTKLRACDAPEEDEERSGADPCAQGPKYWCRSVATAAACDALEHCRRHAWR